VIQEGYLFYSFVEMVKDSPEPEFLENFEKSLRPLESDAE